MEDKGYIMDGEYTSVRCPTKRPHVINGIEYEDCGAFVFDINLKIDCDIRRRCKVCKRNYIIQVTDGVITFTEIPPSYQNS